jgi:hypothetical protein
MLGTLLGFVQEREESFNRSSLIAAEGERLAAS